MYMKVILIGSTEAECQTLTRMLAGAGQITIQGAEPAISVANKAPVIQKPAAQPVVPAVEVAPKNVVTNPVAATSQNAASPTQTQVETPKVIDVDAIRNIAQSLIETGKRDSLKEVLLKYNAKTVATIDPTNFAAVLADLKAIQ